VSHRLIVGTGVVAAVLAVVVLGFVVTYGRVLTRARQVLPLEQQNQELLREVESVQELGREMEDLNALRAQVLAMLGSGDESGLREMEPLKGLDRSEPDLFADPSRLREVFADAARQPFAPTAWPLPGRVLREFIPGPDGERPPHPGLSISLEPTPEVEAAGRGRVVDIGQEADGDAYLLIDHGYGFQSYYAGLSEVRVEIGQIVEKGTWIAHAGGVGGGRDGRSALYFEIRVDGAPADPRRYLSAR
jgi:septal ring factor EnvC (AmiA/AmiB activator)